MQNPHIVSIYRQNRQQLGHCPILRMSVNGPSTMFSLASWVIYLRIGCRHRLMRYWQPLGAKTPATFSLPHPDNQHHGSVNSTSSCIFYTQGILWIFTHIIRLLTTGIGKNTIYERENTDSKLFHIVTCKTSKNILLVVQNAILIRYY